MSKNLEDYVGRICGSFEIIGFAGKNKYGSRFWFGKCHCGQERKLRTSLISGGGKRKATQCNVCTKRNGILANQTQSIIPHRFWKRFCDQAARRKIDVTISKDEAYALFVKQEMKCAITHDDLYFTLFRANFNRYTNASLDRIDSKQVYSIDNVQWVHKTINMMKGTLSQAEFLMWCRKVANKERG